MTNKDKAIKAHNDFCELIRQARELENTEKSGDPELIMIDNFDWGDITIKPCPFCGRDLKDSDRQEALHTERTPDGGRSWIIHCAECDFGCGVEMRGESEEEVLMKWNRRLSFE